MGGDMGQRMAKEPKACLRWGRGLGWLSQHWVGTWPGCHRPRGSSLQAAGRLRQGGGDPPPFPKPQLPPAPSGPVDFRALQGGSCARGPGHVRQAAGGAWAASTRPPGLQLVPCPGHHGPRPFPEKGHLQGERPRAGARPGLWTVSRLLPCGHRHWCVDRPFNTMMAGDRAVLGQLCCVETLPASPRRELGNRLMKQ